MKPESRLPLSDRIKVVLFDRQTGKTWSWFFKDPPPPELLIPDEEWEPVTFNLLYYELEGVDGQVRAVYTSQRGVKGERNESIQ